MSASVGATRRDLWLILVLTLAKGIVWSVVQPPLQAPDETAHFTYVQYLAENGQLPKVGPTEEDAPEVLEFWRRARFSEVRSSAGSLYRPVTGAPPALSRLSANGNSSAGAYPPAYYACAALCYRLAYRADVTARFYAARLSSAFLGLLTVAAAWLIGRSLFPRSRTFPAAFCLTAGLQPMNSMLGASVNNDALLIPVSAIAFAIVLASWGTRSRLAPLALGTALGIGLLTKPQMIYVAAAATAMFLLRRRASLFNPVKDMLGIVAPVVLVFGWWAVLALIRFGSPLGTMVFQTVREGDSSIWHYARTNLLSRSALVRAHALWIQMYWGRFGWLDTPFPNLVYAIILLLVLLALVGLVVAHRRRELPNGQTIALCGLFVLGNLAFLYAVEAQYVHRFHTTMLQGRYLLTALLPITVLLLVGWRGLVPGRWRGWSDAAAASAGVLLNVAAVRLLLFRYYGIGIRDAVTHPELVAGIVPGPLFTIAKVGTTLFAVLSVVVLVRLARAAYSEEPPPSASSRRLPAPAG